MLLTPTKLPKVLGIADPSALRVAENVAELLPESTASDPVVVAGNWLRIETGTVNVFAPAVVTKMNVDELVTLLPTGLVAMPPICWRSPAGQVGTARAR